MQKVLMIVNPKAGKAKSKKYIQNILINLKNSGFNVELEFTTPERNATAVIKEHKLENEKLIVWGGDGTLNEALIGLDETHQDAEIAFIPMGTTNDFARTLKVSFDELAVSKKLSHYKVKEVDMGRIDGMPFNYAVSVGLFSKASYQTSRKWKNRIGKLAYYFNGMKEFFNYKTQKLKVIVENQVIEDEFIYASVSNTRFMGGFPVFRKKEIQLDDGEFEVILAKAPKFRLYTVIVVIKILTGAFSDKYIQLFKAPNVKIEAPNGVELSIDGEYGGKRTAFEIQTCQKHTKYLIP